MITSTKFTKTATHTSKISGAKAEIFEYYCEWRKRTVYAATVWRNRRAKKVDQRGAYDTPEQRAEAVRRYFQRQIVTNRSRRRVEQRPTGGANSIEITHRGRDNGT